MIEQAITKIETLARAANGIEVKHDPVLRVAFIRNGTEFSEKPIPKRLRGGSLLGVEDLIAAVLDEGFSKKAEVYHDRERITLLVDREDRNEVVTMPLALSSRFTTLAGIHRQPLSAPQLISILRFDLPCSASEGLIQSLRNVDFSRKSDGRTTTEHGRESFGRSVEAQIQGTDKVPENVVIEVPVYNVPGLVAVSTVPVRCGIHIDPQNEVFTFRPLADEIDLAVHSAQMKIGNLLRERMSGTPVFYGAPARADGGVVAKG